MKQHLHLTGEEGPGAVRELPANHITLLASDYHLTQHTLRHPEISLPRTWWIIWKHYASYQHSSNIHDLGKFMRDIKTNQEGKGALASDSSRQSHHPWR